MLQFFYRAWADSQPAAQADRPADDRFADHVARLTGAAEGVGDASDFPARARLHYAALFASRRSAGAIEDAMTHLLGQPVRVLEFQPRWREIDDADRTRLGRSFCGLGNEAMLGGRAKIASDAFRVVIRARSRADYEALLPLRRAVPYPVRSADRLRPQPLRMGRRAGSRRPRRPSGPAGRHDPPRLDRWLGGGGEGVRGDAICGGAGVWRDPGHDAAKCFWENEIMILKQGVRGEEVKKLQQILRQFQSVCRPMGFSALERSVRSGSLNALGLYPPDGIVGPLTWGARSMGSHLGRQGVRIRRPHRPAR